MNNAIRWIESAQGAGFRYVAPAFELVNDRGAGFYADLELFEIFTPIVLQLPARNGRPVYIGAYESNDFDGIVIDSAGLFIGERGEEASPDLFGAHRDAAHSAISFAEMQAEKEREYKTAWSAGLRFQANRDEMRNIRMDARAIIQALKMDNCQSETIRNAALRQVRFHLKELNLLRLENRELIAGDFDGLQFWPDEYMHAFNDGAGL